jgi:hypothetical protein
MNARTPQIISIVLVLAVALLPAIAGADDGALFTIKVSKQSVYYEYVGPSADRVVWDFGDGVGAAQGERVSHTYQYAGHYRIECAALSNGTWQYENVTLNLGGTEKPVVTPDEPHHGVSSIAWACGAAGGMLLILTALGGNIPRMAAPQQATLGGLLLLMALVAGVAA